MRFKILILVTFLFLLACSSGTPGGKGKKSKGKNRKRDREGSRDSSPASDRNRHRGEAPRPPDSPTESHRRGSPSSQDSEPAGNSRGGHSSAPPPIGRDDRHDRNSVQHRRRLQKQDPRRHSSQQNGPLPRSPNSDTPSVIQRRPSGETDPLGFSIGIAAVGTRISTTDSQNRLSEEQKGIFLEAHNQFRSEVSPTAANMVVLEWDDSLADMAQGWADQCTFAHGNPANISPFGYVGQNIWAGSGTTDTWNLFDMVKSWADEKEFYDYNSNSCSGVCGHYTQLVWAATTDVGCALASCSLLEGLGWSPATVLVCNYGEG
ncbi:GLIPR1-like protein 1 [Holothuria leucospilota]|uniref:GLIPR1-like protein 1 n=1 Tax=Holothuria leucospilota TaxID=206669 RepID=A0A9Q1CIA5_HOLLE|nr:GLIPR1-like protein 1 [Holothuria leucospilota]